MQDGVTVHRQLHQLVTEHLRTAILDGDLQPGEWLRQQRIADELGVSQMPVREALKALAAEGVVEYIPYRGARVVEFSPEDVADLYAQRSFLEGRAARAAAHHITPKDLDQLRAIHTQMREQDSLSISSYSSLNHRFHQIIYTASQRDYLIRALDQIWSAFPTMMLSYFAQTTAQELTEREAQDLEEHGAILGALEGHDGPQAEQLMRQHIETNCVELLSILDC
ncbi:MAG: GntR family transcriptional regulator, partial [Anaerolineae bacterium]